MSAKKQTSSILPPKNNSKTTVKKSNQGKGKHKKQSPYKSAT